MMELTRSHREATRLRAAFGDIFALDEVAARRVVLRHMRSTRPLIFASVVVFAASCSSGSVTPNASNQSSTTTVERADSTAPIGRSSTTGTSSPGSTSTSSTTSPAIDQTVADVYLGAVDAEFTASSTADANLPDLAVTHLDPLLQKVRDLVTGRRLGGQATKRPDATKSKTVVISTNVDGDTATVIECTVDDAVVYVKATGQVVNDKVATMRRRATMKKDGEYWKVSERVNEQEWEGVAGCAVS